MRAETNAVTTQSFATRAVLGLELVALAVGVLQFTFATATVTRPLLAATGLALLSVTVVAVRAIPALQRSHARQHWLAIIVLLICISLLVVATGGVGSALVTLYLIPLAAVAIAFGNWLLVALISVAIIALGYALGAVTPGIDIRTREFAVLLMSALAPGVAVAVTLGALIGQMQTAAQRIRDLAATDSLTGLLNLRAFEEILQQEHRKAERFGRPYTLIVVDTDNLKLVNETLGHEAGSQVIVAVAAAIARSIRGSDIAARLGGDEFVVLLSEADAATGAAIAQRIRNNVYAGTVSVANRLIRANASLGVATFPEDHLYPKELMILADQRMQQDRELRRPSTDAQ
jgi:diguanylate cyclase (GGDEF)-like protein